MVNTQVQFEIRILTKVTSCDKDEYDYCMYQTKDVQPDDVMGAIKIEDKENN